MCASTDLISKALQKDRVRQERGNGKGEKFFFLSPSIVSPAIESDIIVPHTHTDKDSRCARHSLGRGGGRPVRTVFREKAYVKAGRRERKESRNEDEEKRRNFSPFSDHQEQGKPMNASSLRLVSQRLPGSAAAVAPGPAKVRKSATRVHGDT